LIHNIDDISAFKKDDGGNKNPTIKEGQTLFFNEKDVNPFISNPSPEDLSDMFVFKFN
jgi:hypothetical protein